MALPAPALFTVEEYLDFETKSQTKHEYYDGSIIAMSGASNPHLDIQTNLIVALSGKFKAAKKSCKPYASDMRVYVDETKYFYPAVTVFCGKISMDNRNTAKDPAVVIEILSPSTAAYDQNEKAAGYRQITALKQLVLIDSRRRSAVVYTRGDDRSWTEKMLGNEDAGVTIADVFVTFDEIYESVV